MKNTLLLLFLLSIFFGACRKDFDLIESEGNLSFSKDTVFLDTVFTGKSSSTYRLKVYNKSNQNVLIPSVGLGRGENSFYRLNIDGKPGKVFQNIEILSKDSIYIFIETTIDYNRVTNPIYSDSIVFKGNSFSKNVKLITLVQDAHFLFPSKNAQGIIETITLGQDLNGKDIKINGFYLADNTTWTNTKPYVIFGYCAVPENKTLTVEAGTKIHFHNNSGLIVDKNATLKINGTLQNKVKIEGDRLEPYFENIAGQWGAIWLRAGSKNHEINHTLIKNGTIGILIDSIGSNSTPTLKIQNTEIYNHSNYGILARESNIEGSNLVINKAGFSSLACTMGGTYNFIHCTFVNYWNISLRQFPAVLINNFYTYFEGNKQIMVPKNLKEANFSNSIIYGNNRIELILDKVDGADFNFNFQNNLIQFDDYNNSYSSKLQYQFTNINYYQNIIFNQPPDFKNPQLNQLMIGKLSSGIQKGAISKAIQIPQDILGKDRTGSPDLGAYQHINFQ
ncbi:MAG: hypothetical protein Q8J84_05645 [Flavobacteriaceae bacterium]|nr:hypothetical protein [Flavobacteriaceae bacterium]